MTIRPYENKDRTVVFDIFSRAKPDELRGSVRKEDIVPLEKDQSLLKSFSDSIIYVAEQDNRIVGFAGYNKFLISFLFTDPDFYRQKVGERLLEHILALIGNKAWLLVLKSNLPAISLYKKFGFSIAEEFSGKYNGRIDVSVLRLALEPGLQSWKVNKNE